MSENNAFPQQGDIWKINHNSAEDPKFALVISKTNFNSKLDMCLICLIDTTGKYNHLQGFLVEIRFDNNRILGHVVSSHVTTIQHLGQQGTWIERVPPDVVHHIKAKLQCIITG